MKNSPISILKAELFSFFMMVIFLYACEDRDKKTEIVQASQATDQNPKVDVRVNKTYDKKGNLIRFDSTYSYLYKSGNLDSSKVRLDTVLERFKSRFDDNFSERWDREFKNMFLTDSLFRYDFPNENYFSKRFELNMSRMKQLMLQMDSIKTSFLKEPPASNNKIN